jgi:hypothetical protein
MALDHVFADCQPDACTLIFVITMELPEDTENLILILGYRKGSAQAHERGHSLPVIPLPPGFADSRLVPGPVKMRLRGRVPPAASRRG